MSTVSRLSFIPWEPEETVGKIWHALVGDLGAPETHVDAAVALEEVAPGLAVFFRALGGGADAGIRPVKATASRHRLGWKRALATAEDRVVRPSFDGESLRLPERIAVFPVRADNRALYFWIAAFAAHATGPVAEADPLRADLRALRVAHTLSGAVLADCPGLAEPHTRLCSASLRIRVDRALPPVEAAIEATIRALLGDTASRARDAGLLAFITGEDPDLSAMTAPRGYRPFQPVPLWPELHPRVPGARLDETDPVSTGMHGDAAAEGHHRARRRQADQAERRDSLILHRFETLLSWAEFLNVNRRVEDDDPENARKALDEQDEIALGAAARAPSTRLKLDLDLAPQDVDRERLSAPHTYPEWDCAARRYLPDHCRVLASGAEPCAGHTPHDEMSRRRMRAVRRQFEALRPRRVSLPGQPDGEELDLEAAVRARTDLQATGTACERIWRSSHARERNLAVSILLDVSRSTESAVTGRAVIDIEREALTALSWGLAACGDDCAIHAFSSLRRDRVYVLGCKMFAEPMGAAVEARIAGLSPGFYTRLGAAVRHVSADLARQPRQRRLLLVITDGKPNDVDHYEGRHGIEDSRMAIREARRAGQAVFGIVVDSRGQAGFRRIFGQNRFAVIPHPDRLITVLPAIYRQLTGV